MLRMDEISADHGQYTEIHAVEHGVDVLGFAAQFRSPLLDPRFQLLAMGNFQRHAPVGFRLHSSAYSIAHCDNVASESCEFAVPLNLDGRRSLVRFNAANECPHPSKGAEHASREQ